jgi:hypothetical protein
MESTLVWDRKETQHSPESIHGEDQAARTCEGRQRTLIVGKGKALVYLIQGLLAWGSWEGAN